MAAQTPRDSVRLSSADDAAAAAAAGEASTLQVDISRTPSINTVVKIHFLIAVLCVVDLSQLISIKPEKPGAIKIL